MEKKQQNRRLATLDHPPKRAVFTPLSAPGERERRDRNKRLFGADVARWRRAQAMTQMQASVALGVHIQTLRNWEQGLQLPPPGVRNMIRLAMMAVWHNLGEWGHGKTAQTTMHPVYERVEMKRSPKITDWLISLRG